MRCIRHVPCSHWKRRTEIEVSRNPHCYSTTMLSLTCLARDNKRDNKSRKKHQFWKTTHSKITEPSRFIQSWLITFYFSCISIQLTFKFWISSCNVLLNANKPLWININKFLSGWILSWELSALKIRHLLYRRHTEMICIRRSHCHSFFPQIHDHRCKYSC